MIGYYHYNKRLKILLLNGRGRGFKQKAVVFITMAYWKNAPESLFTGEIIYVAYK
nr:hypothetical protein [Mucilaginibacter sp. X4EP1]